MAFTRKMLKSMGLTEEQVDAVIDAHVEAVEPLKAYEADAKRLPEVQKELDDLKAKGDGGYKDKYEQEHKAYEDYKAEVAAKAAKAERESLYRGVLKKIGVDTKYHDLIVRGTDLSSIAVKDGKLEDETAVADTAKREYHDFISATTTTGSDVPNPPVADPPKPAPNKRAAEIAAEYHKSLYGETETKKE